MHLQNLKQYLDYPFESMSFITKLELCEFKLGKQPYAFDFYRIDPRDELIIQPDVNGVPGYKIHGDETEMLIEKTDGALCGYYYGSNKKIDMND